MRRLVTWNVNSIKIRIDRLLKLIERHRPDVICLQELKTIDANFPLEPLTQAGYHCAVYGQKTYNGVAILSKEEPQEVIRGFGDDVDDPASRFILARFDQWAVASAYIPNGQEVGSPAYAYKLQWLSRLRRLLDADFEPSENLVIAGDFNVAPEDRDVHDPNAWRGKILFSEPEKAALKDVMEFGLVDVFRRHHAAPGLYSWWDYRQMGFPFNRGLRIDFILASDPLAEKCRECFIDREERKGEKPSDHAPVIADFDLD